MKNYSSKCSNKSFKKMTTMKSYGSATTFRNSKMKKFKNKQRLLESYMNKENITITASLERGKSFKKDIYS